MLCFQPRVATELSASKMMSSFYFFEEYDTDVTYHLGGFLDDCEAKPTHLFLEEDMEGGGGVEDLWSGYKFYPENHVEKGASFPSLGNPQNFQEFMEIDDTHFNAVSAATQSIERPKVGDGDLERSLISEISELRQSKDKTLPTSISLLDLSKCDRPCSNGGRINELEDKETNSIARGRELSTEEVVRVAAAHFIQLSSLVTGDPSMLRLPFGLSLSSLAGNEVKNVELASLLMSTAEKVSNQQYDRANRLVRQCNMFSSNTGNPVQRLVYYFSDAIQERINRETGRLSLKDRREMGTMTPQDVIKAVLTNHPVLLVANNTLPFPQVSQFTAIQTILDNVASAKRIHMIDLSIKFGHQWTILMQALATRHACRIDSLKISAVGAQEEVIAVTGKRLSSFAKSLRLPFEFRAVIVPDMKDLREDMFELEEGETVGIYTALDMNSLIVKPDSLDNLMRVIKKLKPCVMTVIDVEANLNSQSFINRFTEALFFFSAFFDCLDSLMDRSDGNRMVIEGNFFSQGIKCILAAEGSERVVRQVGVSVWRLFFARFGLMEAELSEWSMYQASLLIKQYVKDSSCTLEKNGKSLLIGWKGTPLIFVSAWKFPQGEGGGIKGFPHSTR